MLTMSKSSFVRAVRRDALIKDEFIRTCVHEAGHTVASHVFGFDLRWVSVDSEFIRNDPVAIEHECASGHPLTMSIASTVLQPILDRGFTASVDERAIIKNYVIMVCAGPLAEMRLDPDGYDIAGSENDFRQAAMLVARVVRKKIDQKRYLDRTMKQAEAFVDQQRLVIANVARALETRKTLMLDEIRPLIEA